MRLALRARQRRRALGEGRREQEPVTIKAVHKNAACPRVDARLVVGISGPHVGAHLDNLGFAEGGMESVGCV